MTAGLEGDDDDEGDDEGDDEKDEEPMYIVIGVEKDDTNQIFTAAF